MTKIKLLITLYRNFVWRSQFVHVLLISLIYAAYADTQGYSFAKTWLWNLPTTYLIGVLLCIYREYSENKDKTKK